MLVFTGSVALNKHRSVPKPINDIDAIADYDAAAGFLQKVGCTEVYPIDSGKKLFGRNPQRIYEIEIAWPDTTASSLLDRVPECDGGGLPLNLLYTLKMSHRYRKNSPHFVKTMRDIHEMRRMGATIPEDWSDWYKARQRETYSYKLPNLNTNKSEFFADQYQFDHDSIHQAVAIEGCPAYFYYQDGEVWSSKDKFFEQSDYVRLCGVVEEASVLALERSLIPFPGAKTEDQAFVFALQKVCTSITSGWFREYAWENYDAAIELYRSRPTGLLDLLAYGLRHNVVKENPQWSISSVTANPVERPSVRA